MSLETLALTSGIAPGSKGYGIFDGTAYGEIASVDAGDFAPGNYITIEAIVNTIYSSANQMIYAMLKVSSHLYLYIDTSGKLSCILRDEDLNQLIRVSTDTINDGLNHYVAVTIDRIADELKLYIDGVQNGSTLDISTITGSILEDEITIGALEDGGNHSSYFNGNISTVHYTDKTKTAAEILSTYNSEIISDADTVALWQFQYGDGTDRENSHDLTMTNVTYRSGFSLLELTSGIETALSLESEIASKSLSPSFFVLLFDGGDWMEFDNIPSTAQLSGDWYFECDVFIPTGHSQASTIFGIGDSAGGATIQFGVSAFEALILYIEDTASDTLSLTMAGEVSTNAWTTIKLEKSGSTITISATKTGQSTITDSGTWPGEISTHDNGKLGWIDINGSDPVLINGTKIRNIIGTFYELGEPYSDIDKTIIAGSGDNIAAIINIGLLGGDIIQDTENARPMIDTAIFNSLLALESSLL